jgi:Trp operon repressor
MFSRKDLERLNRLAVRKLNEVTDDGTPKSYLNFDEGITAYSRILETGITAQQALEYVAECYGKDSEWVNEVKNSNYLHARHTVKEHKHHPIQKAMLKDGSMRTKALTNSRTPNQQLRELHSQRKLHTTLQALKEKDLHLEGKVEALEVQSVVTDTNLETVMDLLGVDKLTNKEKASKLKAKGITQKKISDYLCVGIATIKRWWPTL